MNSGAGVKRFVVAFLLTLSPTIAVGGDATFTPPSWAYPVKDPDFKPEPDDGLPKTVPGSDRRFTVAQVQDLFSTTDWFPGEHPPMPGVVAHGRKPAVRACGVCHMADGTGHPENGSLAGQPAGYIIQQMEAFRNGQRKSMLPDRSRSMINIAAAITDAEIKAAADYFSSIKFQSRVTVKETNIVPVTMIGLVSNRKVKPNAGTEPLGKRVIEVAEDSERSELQDPHASFIAYVPVGSISKGEALVKTGGNGKTIACAVCHGPDLKGLGDVPGIAGRSATYTARQLFDMQQGSRNGPATQLMKAVVAKLTEDDIISIVAYTASR